MRNLGLTLLAVTGALLTSAISPALVLAQRVVNVDPASNSQAALPDTSISGQFESANGASVDVSSVRILVNGQDVTSRSTITSTFFAYRPDQPFPPGPVQVQVQYRNSGGQPQTTNWSFSVQQPQPLQITSVTHSGVARSQNTGASFTVTITGTPGAQVSALLIQDGRTVRDVPARETSAGVYVATLRIQQGDRVTNGAVVGRLQRQGQTTYAAAAEPFAFNSSSPTASSPSTSTPGSSSSTSTPSNTTLAELKPRFTSPQSGSQVSGDGFVLIGQTLPNAQVQVMVTSKVSVFGVDLGSIGSETLVDREVRASNSGEFRIQVPGPRVPVPGTQYTVQATARRDNQTSETAEMTLRQR